MLHEKEDVLYWWWVQMNTVNLRVLKQRCSGRWYLGRRRAGLSYSWAPGTFLGVAILRVSLRTSNGWGHRRSCSGGGSWANRNKEKQNDLGTLSPLLVTLNSPKLYSLSMSPAPTALTQLIWRKSWLAVMWDHVLFTFLSLVLISTCLLTELLMCWSQGPLLCFRRAFV